MNIISYSLFGTNERYWKPIPYVLIANSIIYENFIIRFYISQDAVSCSAYSLLNEVSKNFPYVETKIINKSYINTEPTTWRMMPLWDANANFVLCRDLDAAPMTDEVRATYYFMKTNMAIHGIRGYKTHDTALMAGLCAFNVPLLRQYRILVPKFDDYINFGNKTNRNCPNWVWGCDQELLRNFFYKRANGPLMARVTLDTPLNDAPEKVGGLNFIRKSQEEYDKIVLNIKYPEILEMGDSIHDFPGSPFKPIQKEHILKAMDINCQMSMFLKDLFSKNNNLREFYL